MLKVINLKIKIDTRNSIFFVIYLKLVNSMVDKEKKMIFGIGIVFLFLATVTFSYAYFTATLVNNNVKDQVVQTGTLELTYTDGPEIVMNNIKPGTTITKEISVKNTGTLDTSYNLIWQELVNEITNDEMVIEATCTRMDATTETESGSCNSITTKPIKDENIRKVLKKYHEKGVKFLLVSATREVGTFENKLELLKQGGVYEYFGFINTDCKHVVRADVLIDDYIGNLDTYKHYHPFAWTLLYDMPHNQNVNQDGVHTRVRNWEEIDFCLNEILKDMEG